MMKNGDNRFEATVKNIGLPGLNLDNKDLQNIIFRYLNELKLCGVKGLRFDAAKHIGLPKDGVNFFKRVNSPDIPILLKPPQSLKSNSSIELIP
jgi:glycosidase